ncbi:MAG: helicase C-terminal domain-containing protein [Thermodesulfobacteriota bacterium]|nr:helicase C-terminal domain-containing protein [Thermodesulfobacteriota bacterium]
MKSYSPNSIISIREAIAESNGNEVFFLGHTDCNLNIWSVTVLARGNKQAVPALKSRCHSGDTVIHNHPSGDLTPSAADLKIAAQLGELGIGCHIVDNAVENVYKMVDACPSQTQKKLKADEIATILGTSGSLAHHLGSYEERPEQLRMAFASAEAFNNDGLATIEAGTGTGKSLAYLIPAILWSLRNEEPIAISTNTINLQEQLLRQDLPLLKKAIGEEFLAVLVKGRNNYLCLRRLDNAYREPDLFNNEHAGELETLRTWSISTRGGSRDELNIVPTGNVWSEVCCEMDQCPRTRCPHYKRCFFHKARRRAAHADLLIVNHSLLLSDLVVRLQTDNYSATAVLPPYNRIVIDEAHHLEDAATSNFSIRISKFNFSRILNRLTHPRKQERGLLPQLLSSLAKELPDSEATLYDSLYKQLETLLSQCRTLRDQANEQFKAQRDALTVKNTTTPSRNDLRWRITPTEAKTSRWKQLHTSLRPLVLPCADTAKGLTQLLKNCDQQLPEKTAEALNAQLTDIQGISDRLSGLCNDLDYVLALDDQACTWVEIVPGIGRHKEMNLWLNTAPISVARTLKQAIYDRFRTIILTSATLTTNHSFTFFHQRTGLDLCPAERRSELLLESPFDFAGQAVIAMPTDIVEPNHEDYASMLAQQIEMAIQASCGRTFALFTAYSLLRKLYNQLDASLNAQGFHCLCQGQASRHLMIEQFKHGDGKILFGTDSFWEGVDVPGRALEQVIITRLPFRVPTEPIQIARCETIEQQGSNPFTMYTVPQAIIRFKQGFGRLIRHRNDRGVVLILDKRIVSKYYGRMFLNSLPPARRITAPTQQVQQALRSFFDQPE